MIEMNCVICGTVFRKKQGPKITCSSVCKAERKKTMEKSWRSKNEKAYVSKRETVKDFGGYEDLKPSPVRIIPCRCCEELFESSGKHNRLCRSCRVGGEYVEPYALSPVFRLGGGN
jgi:hypothetical protein